MRFDEVVSRLTPAAFAALPGAAAQERLAPRPRRLWIPGHVPESARSAAGLALLYPREEQAVLVLTVRGQALAQHGGQVALPGGAVEEGESIEEAALREAREEVGLEPGLVTVRGRLTPLHIPVSGFGLVPVVGTAEEPPALRPCEREVSRIVAAPIDALLDPRTLEVRRREIAGAVVEVPGFEIGGATLWGATAMIVSELLALLGHPLDPWV